MIKKKNIEVEQRNKVLEDQINHVKRLLEEEKLNYRRLNEELGKAVIAKNKLRTELKTCNDAYAWILGCIRLGFTATISQLKGRLDEETERLQRESKRSQEIEATWRELLRENRTLKSEMSEKDEELTNLKKKNTIIENRNIKVEQINTDDRIDHINRLLEAEKLNSRILNEQLVKAVNEKHKLMTELKTYNDGLTRIQGFIHRSLTSRLSLLRHIATTIKLGYYEDLLARINALGQVKEHLPKLWGTIEIATSLSAYIPVAAMFVRLRAYHGDILSSKFGPAS